MEFQSVLNKRKMVRSFDEKAIPDDIMKQIIENILKAPSAGYSQGTQVLVLNKENSRSIFFAQWGKSEERATYLKSWPNLDNAPLILLVCADKSAYVKRYSESDKTKLSDDTIPWWFVDAGMSVLLGLLSAIDHGLVATFTGIKDQNYLRNQFDVPKSLIVVGAVLIGYQLGEYRPSTSVKRGKRPLDEIVHYNKW